MSIFTRKLEADEIELHRDLRLRALSDSPDSHSAKRFPKPLNDQPPTGKVSLTRSPCPEDT